MQLVTLISCHFVETSNLGWTLIQHNVLGGSVKKPCICIQAVVQSGQPHLFHQKVTILDSLAPPKGQSG